MTNILFDEFFVGALFRFLGVCILLPLPGNIGGLSTKLTLSLICSLSFATQEHCSVNQDMSVVLVLRCALDFLVGLFIVAPYAVLIALVRSGGDLFDTLRGQFLGAQYSVLTQELTSTTGTLLDRYFWAIFSSTLCLPELVVQVQQSLLHISSAQVLESITAYGSLVQRLVSEGLDFLFLFLLPVALVAILIDVGMGLVGRLVPKAFLLGESFLCKSLAGFCLLLIVVPGLLEAPGKPGVFLMGLDRQHRAVAHCQSAEEVTGDGRTKEP